MASAEPPARSASTAKIGALLEVRNLSVSFETSNGRFFAVEGVDLAVDAGEVLAIVGESGSGKSVAMMAVMGLLPADGHGQRRRAELRGTRPADDDAPAAPATSPGATWR